jgi:G6PDH family F420-dependent oxidoreductase
MAEIGYFLSSEEHGPRDLVSQAQLASDAGIGSVWISDHYHPWLDEQGQSPFVWSVIGGIAATTPLRVTTAVTCPTMRIHPAVVAQAAATCSVLLDGRFELGVGTGEYLNEHILGGRWPPADVRLAMLEEAVELMRRLWTGDEITHHGDHYVVENARIYSLPDHPLPVMVSGFGAKATDLAIRIADGYVSTKPDPDLINRYRSGGGRGPTSAGLKICWGADRDECAQLAHSRWRSSGVPGELSQQLPTPAFFEQASSLVSVESIAEKMPCGPAVEPIVSAVQEYVDAGFDRVYINQVGPNQADFFRFFDHELGAALMTIGVTPLADSDASMLAGS